MMRSNNGKASRMTPSRGVDQREAVRRLAVATQQGPSLAERDADQEEVEALVAAVNQMCRERGVAIEAQVIIQGTQMVSNVVFRKSR